LCFSYHMLPKVGTGLFLEATFGLAHIYRAHFQQVVTNIGKEM